MCLAPAAAAAATVSPPSSAGSEGPLLSGYGGPGASQQALLGGHVPRGRGGGPPGGGAGETAAAGAPGAISSSEAAARGTELRSGSQTSAGARDYSSGGGHGIAHRVRTGSAHGGSGREGTAAHGQSAAVAAQPLGLSGSELLTLALVTCALVGMGFLTRTLARGEA